MKYSKSSRYSFFVLVGGVGIAFLATTLAKGSSEPLSSSFLRLELLADGFPSSSYCCLKIFALSENVYNWEWSSLGFHERLIHCFMIPVFWYFVVFLDACIWIEREGFLFFLLSFSQGAFKQILMKHPSSSWMKVKLTSCNFCHRQRYCAIFFKKKGFKYIYTHNSYIVNSLYFLELFLSFLLIVVPVHLFRRTAEIGCWVFSVVGDYSPFLT